MKSFNEWIKSHLINEEDRTGLYSGWFLGRKLLCLKCGYSWENKDPHLNIYGDSKSEIDDHPKYESGCPKCHAKSDGEGNVIVWDPKDENWIEPESWGPQGAGLDHDSGDNQDNHQGYYDREVRRPPY